MTVETGLDPGPRLGSGTGSGLDLNPRGWGGRECPMNRPTSNIRQQFMPGIPGIGHSLQVRLDKTGRSIVETSVPRRGHDVDQRADGAHRSFERDNWGAPIQPQPVVRTRVGDAPVQHWATPVTSQKHPRRLGRTDRTSHQKSIHHTPRQHHSHTTPSEGCPGTAKTPRECAVNITTKNTRSSTQSRL